MKGVVLAGGNGTRLLPLTEVTNKHLLPVYNKPMIFYPLETLVKAGIKEVMVIVSGYYAGDFIKILKNGREFGLDKLEFAYQENAYGIADALSLAKNFANGGNITVMLGDNTTNADITKQVSEFESGAHIFLKGVEDPTQFGVPKFDVNNNIIKIIEKPKKYTHSLAVTGMYIYDNNVFDYIDKCKPSKRNELEITDVNNMYAKDRSLEFTYLNKKIFWKDAGTIDNLFEANKFWRKLHNECS